MTLVLVSRPAFEKSWFGLSVFMGSVGFVGLMGSMGPYMISAVYGVA